MRCGRWELQGFQWFHLLLAYDNKPPFLGCRSLRASFGKHIVLQLLGHQWSHSSLHPHQHEVGSRSVSREKAHLLQPFHTKERNLRRNQFDRTKLEEDAKWWRSKGKEKTYPGDVTVWKCLWLYGLTQHLLQLLTSTIDFINEKQFHYPSLRGLNEAKTARMKIHAEHHHL